MNPIPDADSSEKTPPIALAVHGGAGAIQQENLTANDLTQYRKALRETLHQGFDVLQDGGSALDAVETAVRCLEDAPHFNAGLGAVFSADGLNELDASIMDGQSLQAGAVAGVRHIRNPVSLARKIMEDTPYVFLTGTGAESFAEESGIPLVSGEEFYTQSRWNALRQKKSQGNTTPESTHGTVGAVALDQNRNLAAATSTGGMSGKKYGRLGDSPLIGAGTYANNATCAVSCTGHGEYFIRNVVAYDIAALMEYRNLPLKEAANLVILEKLSQSGGDGGIIALDQTGEIVMPFNSKGMYRGYICADNVAHCAIFDEEIPE